MKRLYTLTIAILLSYMGLGALAEAGVQSHTAAVQYFQHDSKKGLTQLESKLQHALTVTWNEHNTTPTFVTGTLTPAGYAQSSDKSVDGIRFFSENVEMFGLKEPAKELEVISNVTDKLSMTHVKYQQSINGIKIFQNQIIVHFNRDGSIESVNGRYCPTPVMNTVPTITTETATSIAKSNLKNYKPSASNAEVMIYTRGLQLLLVYAVHLPTYEKPMMTVFINAADGSVVKIDDGLRYDGPTNGTGVGLNGVSKSIHTYLSGGKYYMIDATLPMFIPPIDSLLGVVETYDALNDTSGGGYDSAVKVTDPNNDNNFNDNERLKAAVDAHIYSRDVYEIYKSHFDRNSFDNNGGTLTNVVHYKDKYNNAFWNGYFMSYGDGDGIQFSNLAGGFDVIAHEMTHGVTQHTANLIYENQSGALNEAVSDIFAMVADSTNWLLGEDVYTPGTPGDALRNIQDPHNGHVAGDYEWQPANMSEFVMLPNDDNNDHGGVHTNSGIINKSFYNLASVIGRTKGGMIWYRALTVYLTNSAQFIDARNACLSAAKDLYGNGSTEYNTVGDAFTAVGIDANLPTSYDLQYDDGTYTTGVFETDANWELAVRFTPPVASVAVSNVYIYTLGDYNANGNGSFTLKMYRADGNNGLPGTSILTPFASTPSSLTEWQSFNITNLAVQGDFYVSMMYDGTNQLEIAADTIGNQRAYEYNGSAWAMLTQYSLFMRATVKSVTSVTEIDTRVPSKFELSQNYPNPFNPSTTIRYSLPAAQNILLTVYDLSGRKVADLVNNFQNSGSYEVHWNGTNNTGASVASGVYFYRLQTQNFSETKKLLLMK